MVEEQQNEKWLPFLSLMKAVKNIKGKNQLKQK